MKIFLDDIRRCTPDYTRVDNYLDCIRLLEQNKGKVEELSLDHDLGEFHTGYSVCKWIVENEYYEGLNRIIIHSSNPVGVKNMLELLDHYIPSNIILCYIDINGNIANYYRKRN